jgi:cytidylate kinase
LAQRLGVPYLDTGAMYRAVALLALRTGLRAPLGGLERARLARLVGEHQIDVGMTRGSVRVFIDGEDVSEAIRSPECSSMASVVSEVSQVREQLVSLQRRLGRRSGGVVEGRDIGTVVFPDATLKVFLTAAAGERASRRQRDLADAGVELPLDEVLQQQEERDLRDSSREDSPLVVAPGAIVLDTTVLSVDEVVHRLVGLLTAADGRTGDHGGASEHPRERCRRTLDSNSKTP